MEGLAEGAFGRVAERLGDRSKTVRGVLQPLCRQKRRAAALGRGLKVPVVRIEPDEVEGHFGWLAMFATLDMPSSSALTREKLQWRPTGPGLIADLDGMDYTHV